MHYLQSVQQFFLQNKEMPPIPAGFTNVGGRIAWAKILQLHIERFMAFFKNVYVKIEDNDQVEAAYINQSDIDNMLDSFNQQQPPPGYVSILQEFKKVKVEQEYTKLRD